MVPWYSREHDRLNSKPIMDPSQQFIYSDSGTNLNAIIAVQASTSEDG